MHIFILDKFSISFRQLRIIGAVVLVLSTKLSFQSIAVVFLAREEKLTSSRRKQKEREIWDQLDQVSIH